MDKTPISILQELMTSLKLAPPIYDIQCTGPDHRRQFHCTVTANGKRVSAIGLSKKESKHNAAKNMLSDIKVIAEPSSSTSSLQEEFVNYVGKLNEFAAAKCYKNPIYEQRISTHNGIFVIECFLEDLKVTGCSYNKKDAKQEAAKQMLLKLKILDLYNSSIDISPIKIIPNQKNKDSTYTDGLIPKLEIPEEKSFISHACKSPTSTKIFINYVGQLNEFASINRYSSPVFEQNIYSVNSSFEITCIFKDLMVQGYSSNKKDAKQQAAKQMLLKLKELGIYSNTMDRSKTETTSNVDMSQTYDSTQIAFDKYIFLTKNSFSNSDNEHRIGLNWNDMESHFKTKGFHWKIAEYQHKPLIILIEFRESVLLVTGKNLDEIKQKAACIIKKMINGNYDFTSPF